MAVLHFVFGIFGNATGLFLFLSPIVTFWRIIKNKTIEEFSCIPYNMALLNCLLSAWYGMPFVSPNNKLVWTINGTGAMIEVVYVISFLIHAPRRLRWQTMGMFVLVWFIFGTVAVVSKLVLHNSTRKLFCGFASAIFSIVMYASPLSIVTLVLKTRSVEFMPFFLSLFVFLCGTSWLVYGILGRDFFIMVPNGCGSVLGAIQLILYSIYRNNNALVADPVDIEDTNVYQNDIQNDDMRTEYLVSEII